MQRNKALLSGTTLHDFFKNVLSMYFPPRHGHLREDLVTLNVNRDKGDMCLDTRTTQYDL